MRASQALSQFCNDWNGFGVVVAFWSWTESDGTVDTSAFPATSLAVRPPMNQTNIAICITFVASITPAFAEEIDFNRDVRPILSDACFACHGPDAGTREAELRLDIKAGIFRTTDDVAVVNPKSPADSALLRRIMSDDPDTVMPPHDGGRKLTPTEKRTIKLWIEQGAEWKGHWAYLPPERPQAPQLDVGPTGNDIDRFIQQALSQKKLNALPEADPATLVRRLFLDLTGLPPTPRQVSRFQNLQSTDSWNALVDELLSSPRYAERMTAFWLDLVRYADTNGIHGDNHREVWMYRDYVISAFHRNLAFDQFTIEQLAGDLLPNATDEQKIASGYNRLLMTTREGGAQAAEYLAKYSADRVRNASTVWMGATMGCCECHDHKFDPYSIRDFYQFAAFFADIQDVPVGVQPSVKMPSREQKKRMADYGLQAATLQKKLDTQTPELDKTLHSWAVELQAKLKSAPKTWSPADVVDMKSVAGQNMRLLSDGSILTSGKQPKHDTYRISLAAKPGKLTGVRLESLQHKSFARKSLSRPPGNGNFVLSGIKLTHIRNADATEQSLELAAPVASFEQKSWPIRNALDGNDDTGWAVDGHLGDVKSPIAAFRLKKPVELAAGDRIVVELQQNAVDYHNIGRLRLSTAKTVKPGLEDGSLGIPTEHFAAIEAWPNPAAAQRKALSAFYRTVAPALTETRNQLIALKKRQDELAKQIPETLVTRSQPPRTIRVLARGDWMDDKGDEVSPAVPHFLHQLSSQQRPTRLDLAQWFIDDQNPLVARVFVNRLWQLFFGKGLVKSSDDFGSQGSWPTHPELLDWLAVEFRESGWNVQHVIRLIVSSDAYRRSSAATPTLTEVDPFNNWLASQSRFRLDAEFIRDGALSVSGLLVDRVGGRSVKPYQPAGYWAHLNFPKRKWEADAGEDQYRRGLYTYWCRTFLHPAMRSFDAPSREECTVDRPRSNNSLQALVLLNDPSYVEAARALAGRILQEGGDTTEARLEFLFAECLSRSPRKQESELLDQMLKSQQKEFTASEKATAEFLHIGQGAQSLAGLEPAELAAWTSVARVVLNLHETITRS